MTDAVWREVAAGVHVLRYPVLDVNVTVVRGDDYALVVDSLATRAQADELADGLRTLGVRDFAVVNTHHHFDHCFGNDTLAGPDRPVYAHQQAARRLSGDPAQIVAQAVETYASLHPSFGTELPAVRIRPPDHPVLDRTTLDLGGRQVHLYHPGRGHTDGDLVVQVPDVALTVAGDLVEQGGPPNFDDSFPLAWAQTMAGLLSTLTGPVVPGHGAVVDADFVRAQHAELAELARRIREGHASGADAERTAEAGPFDRATRRTAVGRGYTELSVLP